MAGLGFVGYLLYLPGENGLALALAVVVVVTACGVVGVWSRSSAWTPDHGFWLAIGAALTGVAVPYLAEPYDSGIGAGRELLDDTVAAAICLVGITLTVLRRRLKTMAATSGP